MNQYFSGEVGAIRLASSVTSVAGSGRQVAFVLEERVERFDEPVYREIVGVLSRGGGKEDWRSFCSQWAEGEWRPALNELLVRGLIRTGAARSARGIEAFWESLPAEEPASLAVAVRNLGGAAGSLAVQAIAASGFAVREDAPLMVVLTDDYLSPELESFDGAGRPWLLAKPVGHTIWLGPLFIPGQTACWKCLAACLRRNRWAIAALLPESSPPQPSAAALPASVLAAAGMIATMSAVWLAGKADSASGAAILTVDVRTWEREWHRVLGRADCPACGQASPRSPASMERFVSPLTGIVSNLRVATEPMLAHFHAVGICTPPAPLDGMRPWIQPFNVSGRGDSPRQAQTACIAEGVERYSSTWQGYEPVIRARMSDIGGLSPEDLLFFSDSQYANAAAWNARQEEMHWVPERFDPEREVAWVEAGSLAGQASRFVPAGYCYLWYPYREEPRYCASDSNGCAAGRTMDEAILNGLLELVERDAVAIWWYNRLLRPSLDLTNPGLPELEVAVQELRDGGRQFSVLDLTTDLGIPAYVALAPTLDGREILFASAAHWSPRIAVRKAIGEISQMIRWNVRQPGPAMGAWLASATLATDPHMRAYGSCPLTPEPRERDVAACLRGCVERLKASRLDTLWLDFTRSETGVPVARVIVPGLRHFRARLAPGRLYDVPVRMGWLKEPLREPDLNPVACML
jgi:ribosomal protein S12 methylthiotransferase accessory factor